MSPDTWTLYELMLRSRLFEEAVTELWREGCVSGEMHLGTGEEAIVAGVVSQLRPDDAMALDHRGTPPLLMRGVEPASILRELLGQPGGLCGGRGGHMHLFSKRHLAASSGIVGAAGPAAVGFALAARHLRPGSIAVAFFGEGALNQGMLLESLNLAAVWQLPVLFVCKDDGWSITTRSGEMMGGVTEDRVRGFGVDYLHTDGVDVRSVRDTAGPAIERLRAGGRPVFLHARCVHLEGHFLGYQLLRLTRSPLRELPSIAGPVVRSALRGNARAAERLAGVTRVMSSLLDTIRDPRRDAKNDPVRRTRAELESETDRLAALEEEVQREIEAAVSVVQRDIGS